MKIIQIPKKNHYIKAFGVELTKKGVSNSSIISFHYATPFNFFKFIYLRLKGYDIVHIHFLYAFRFSFLIMRLFFYLCKITNTRIVWEVHNILPHDVTDKTRRMTMWMYKNVDGCIFHSKSDKERTKSLLRSIKDVPSVIAYHPTPSVPELSTVNQEMARKKLMLPLDKKILLCFGFIRAYRGYKYLFEAIREMDVLTLIVGKPYDEKLLKSIKEEAKKNKNIILTDRWVSDEEVGYFFKASDIIVEPYTEITTSGVVPLAYLYGRPVITTRIGGMVEVIKDGLGLLVEPRDSKGLRKAIIKLISKNHDEKKIMKFAKVNMNWEKNTKKIIKFYKNLEK